MELEVRLFANPAILQDGVNVGAFSSLQIQRLMAMLTLEPGERLPRSRIAFRLWSDSPEAQARTNLRKLLHQLRRGIADIERFIEIGQQSIRWRGNPASRVDVIEFKTALGEQDDARAIAVYCGDLLPDCYDDWIIEARRRLREEASEALDRLAAAAEDSGDPPRVIARASERLKLDPCWEPAYRRLMRAHGELGNRAAAMQVYHQCAEHLDAELRVAPDPETQAVYHEVCLRSRDTSPASRAVIGSWPMVGREDELARIASLWQATASGRAHLLLVSGEPGIGKTRLIDEFARDIQAEGNVVRARAYEAAGRLPWGIIVEWLRSQPIRSAIERLAPQWRGVLEILLPELRTTPLPVEKSKAAIIDPSFRRQLFDAVAGTLVATERPTLLIVDDLQWADTDTIQFISFLIASHPTSPVLVAGTVRDEEIDPDHALTRMQTGLCAKGNVTELQLAPLGAAATAQLVFHLTGDTIEPGEADRVWRDTSGLPLYLVEAARAGLTGRSSITVPLSPTVRAMIASRLDRLSPTVASVVEVAATIGQAFNIETLTLASQEDEVEVHNAVDELWRRRIIRERGAAYDFTHARIREVAYERISPARRRRLHREIADAMLTVHGNEAGPHSARIARHQEAAGRMRAAVDAHRQAAEHAATVYSLGEAIASCQRGLALFEQLAAGPKRDARELELRLALGPPAVARDGYGSAIARESYERSLVLCKRLGREVEPAILRGLGLAAVTACDFERSTRWAKALLALEDDVIARTEGHYLYGVSSFWRGDLESAEQHLSAAISSYDPGHGPMHRKYFAQDPEAVCLIRLALTRLWRGDVGAARRLARRAQTLAASLDHPLTCGYVRLYEAVAAIELDDVGWLRNAVREGNAAVKLGAGLIEKGEQLYATWLDATDARREAPESLEQAVAGMRTEHETLHLTHALSLLARAHLRAGNFDRGLGAVSEALDWGVSHDQRYTEPLLRRVEGDLLLAKGDRSAAANAFTQSLEVSRAQGAAWFASMAVDRLEALHK